MMRGWRYEGYRHSLAARGIPTRYYFADKGEERNVIKEFMANPTTEETEMHRNTMLARVRAEVSSELDRGIAEGRISSDDALRFWRDDFEIERELFMNNGQSYEMFHANVERKLKSHMHMRKKGGLDVFDWAKKEGDDVC
jgi:hypothetical protein